MASPVPDQPVSNQSVPNQSAQQSGLVAQPDWWFKPVIWIVLIALIYVLKEFFLIGFLTFLICFLVRGLVRLLKRQMAPNNESHWLDLILTLFVFVAFCATLYAAGRFFVPQVVRQGRSLLAHLQNASIESIQNTLLANTIGNWQFHRQFGSPTDDRYANEFKSFQQSGRSGEGLYKSFPQLYARLQTEFESNFEQVQLQHLQSDSRQGSLAKEQFEQWLLQIRVPRLFEDKSDYYISRWQQEFEAQGKTDELAMLKQKTDFESIRDLQIHQRILADLKADPVLYAEYGNQWAEAQSVRQWAEFRKSADYQDQFKSFFETRRQENPDAVPLDYDFFQTLVKAYPKGNAEFLMAVQQHYKNDSQSPAVQHQDFETATKLQLGQQWWGSSHIADWIRDHATKDGPGALVGWVGWMEERFGDLVKVPIQVVTALILAIFILIEWPGMKKNVASLRDTRLRPVFEEIAPGIVALGKLIGKSFQGQMVIALFNSLFTLIALWIIGIEYKFILTMLVFLFSFIPVVGVILSGIPLCAVAIFQPGGSLIMALQVIVAVAIIHLIEGMILSPQIIGKIGHLPPVLVIVILLVSEHFFGMWGLILGVPVAIYLIRIVILNTAIPGVYDPTETYANG